MKLLVFIGLLVLVSCQTTTTTEVENATTTIVATTTASPSGLTDGQIAGIVLGSVAAVFVLLGILVCVCQNYTNRRYRRMAGRAWRS